jgi:hypothetical protein
MTQFDDNLRVSKFFAKIKLFFKTFIIKFDIEQNQKKKNCVRERIIRKKTELIGQ